MPPRSRHKDVATHASLCQHHAVPVQWQTESEGAQGGCVQFVTDEADRQNWCKHQSHCDLHTLALPTDAGVVLNLQIVIASQYA